MSLTPGRQGDSESPRQVNKAMRVKRFGITVAHFNKIIRKLD